MPSSPRTPWAGSHQGRHRQPGRSRSRPRTLRRVWPPPGPPRYPCRSRGRVPAPAADRGRGNHRLDASVRRHRRPASATRGRSGASWRRPCRWCRSCTSQLDRSPSAAATARHPMGVQRSRSSAYPSPERPGRARRRAAREPCRARRCPTTATRAARTPDRRSRLRRSRHRRIPASS